VRFDPYVGLGGRLFLAMLGINDFARRLGLPSLFTDLCKQVIKRGEHRLVIESDGALLGSRRGVRFRGQCTCRNRQSGSLSFARPAQLWAFPRDALAFAPNRQQ
jgi:hypothetical protein